jgi:serine phosphatase RsbU (regulator of sigma subunit)
VVGHGLAAAQLMSQVRAVLRSTTLHTDDPAAMLATVNEYVRNFHPRTLATVLCGVLHPATYVLRLSSAGHPPPILSRPGGDAITMDITVDPPLGVDTGRPRHTVDVPLTPGAVLCLYSDGLVERRDVVIDDNIEKLRRTVTADAPESVCVTVMQRLIGGDTPMDDVAVLVVRRLVAAPG